MNERDGSTRPEAVPPDSSRGLVAAMGAYLLWGLLPIYWKALDGVPALQILSHRILWSLLFLLGVLGATREWRSLTAILRNRGLLLRLTGSGVFLGLNWLLYIWAVNEGHILETSLGYYITPLLNVLSGRLLFRDRLSPLQALALGLAALGVLLMVFRYGEIPWVALSIALTFAVYGLMRKVIPVDAVPGLLTETALLTPLALAYLLFLGLRGEGAFPAPSAAENLLLVGTGVATSVPLLFFTYGTRHIRLTTLGFLQYVSPSITFLLGLFVYGEPLSAAKVSAFGLIWGALILYTLDGLRRSRPHHPAEARS